MTRNYPTLLDPSARSITGEWPTMPVAAKCRPRIAVSSENAPSASPQRKAISKRGKHLARKASSRALKASPASTIAIITFASSVMPRSRSEGRPKNGALGSAPWKVATFRQGSGSPASNRRFTCSRSTGAPLSNTHTPIDNLSSISSGALPACRASL